MYPAKKTAGTDPCFLAMVLFVAVVILWAIWFGYLSALAGLLLQDPRADRRELH